MNGKRIIYDLKYLERAYNLCPEEQKALIEKDLPIFKLVLKILNLTVNRTEFDIIHLFSKIDFLHFCLTSKRTKRIHPIVILQYFELRETEITSYTFFPN